MKLPLLCLALLSHYSFGARQPAKPTVYLNDCTQTFSSPTNPRGYRAPPSSPQHLREALRVSQNSSPQTKEEDENIETVPYVHAPLVRTQPVLDLINEIVEAQALRRQQEAQKPYDWSARVKQIRETMRGKNKKETPSETYQEFDLQDLVRIAVLDLKLKDPREIAEALRRIYKRNLSLSEAASMFVLLNRLKKESEKLKIQ